MTRPRTVPSNNVLWALLLALLAGCSYATAPAPYCIVSYGPPVSVGGPPVVACQCSSGAVIPDVCGGGIAP